MLGLIYLEILTLTKSPRDIKTEARDQKSADVKIVGQILAYADIKDYLSAIMIGD